MITKEILSEATRLVGADRQKDYGDKVENHKNSESGLNVATGEMVNMFAYGIIDPFKVVRCALQNAASAASTLLLTDYAIVEAKE